MILTLCCSAKPGVITGIGGGIWAETVENQVRQTMRNLLDGLEDANLDFSHVAATHVYLDNMREFSKMNQVVAKHRSRKVWRMASLDLLE